MQYSRFLGFRTCSRLFARTLLLCLLLILSGGRLPVHADARASYGALVRGASRPAPALEVLASADDYRWDSIFGNPGADNIVRDLVVDSRGYLYAAGDFSAIGITTTSKVAVWHDGYWTKLSHYTSNPVYALAVGLGDVIYAGGAFTQIGDITVHRVARWNGMSWSALGEGLNGTVRALAVAPDGTLYAGGYFTSTTANTLSLRYIAKWNGTTWSSVGAGFNGAVYALAFDAAGNLYAGGMFTATAAPDSLTVNYIAIWNGSSWSALGAGVNSHIYALAASGSNIWAGGAFTEPESYIARWNGSSWLPAGPGLNDPVASLAVDGARVYAGGYFTGLAGSTSGLEHIALWNGSTWAPLGSGTGGTIPTVETLTLNRGHDLFVGGYFTLAGAKTANHIARWDIASYRVNVPVVMRDLVVVPRVPAPPSDLTATTWDDDEIDLAWMDNADNEKSFIVENSTDGVHFSYYGTLPANTQFATDSELTPGTYYCYRIIARNEYGDSNPSNTACDTTTSHIAPLAPSKLTAQVISSTLLLLTWENNSACDGYYIWESVDGGAFQGPYTVSPAGMLPGAYVPGVSPQHTYAYKVRAFNAYGQSPDSNTSNTVTTPALPPSAPTQVRVNNNAAYPVISLRIDGGEQFPTAPMGLPPDTYYLKQLAPGPHSYTASTGFWSGSSRVEMYTYSGAFSINSGQTTPVNLNDPTIAQILTRFSDRGYYVGEYWSGTIIHAAAFRFYANGTYTFYKDGASLGSGTYALVTYGGNYLVTFQATGTGGGTGYMDERTGSFYMRNGPPDWPTIQYSYDGR